METTISNPLIVILTAAGASTRMGGGIKKEYRSSGSGTVLSQAAQAFLKAVPLSLLIVTYPQKNTSAEDAAAREACTDALTQDSFVKESLFPSSPTDRQAVPLLLVPGGSSRQLSVKNALVAAENYCQQHQLNSVLETGFVAIHDGARPYVTPELITRTFLTAENNGAAAPGLEPIETQVEIDEKGMILRHLSRNRLSSIQTPQIFRLAPLIQAHKQAEFDGRAYTDDTEIWDTYCAVQNGFHAVQIVKGDSCNKKITLPQDLPAAESDS